MSRRLIPHAAYTYKSFLHSPHTRTSLTCAAYTYKSYLRRIHVQVLPPPHTRTSLTFDAAHTYESYLSVLVHIVALSY
jgi:hypothetical protein